jgi:hypothetical protein
MTMSLNGLLDLIRGERSSEDLLRRTLDSWVKKYEQDINFMGSVKDFLDFVDAKKKEAEEVLK